MSQIQNSKRASLRAVHFRDLEIRILNLFRISKFELRISKGKLDHFVNSVVTKMTQNPLRLQFFSAMSLRGCRKIHGISLSTFSLEAP